MDKAEFNCDQSLYENLLLGLVRINTLSAIIIGFTETGWHTLTGLSY